MNFERVTVDTLRQAIGVCQCQVVDVREPAEFAREHISGSENIPLTDLDESLKKISARLPVYLVCTSGKKATVALEKLKRAGYDNVRVVAGGLLAWSIQGFPILRPHPAAEH